MFPFPCSFASRTPWSQFVLPHLQHSVQNETTVTEFVVLGFCSTPALQRCLWPFLCPLLCHSDGKRTCLSAYLPGLLPPQPHVLLPLPLLHRGHLLHLQQCPPYAKEPPWTRQNPLRCWVWGTDPSLFNLCTYSVRAAGRDVSCSLRGNLPPPALCPHHDLEAAPHPCHSFVGFGVRIWYTASLSGFTPAFLRPLRGCPLLL